MTPAAAVGVIQTFVRTAWAAGPGTPIAFPNVDFTPTTTGNWLRVDFIWGAGAIQTKGVTNGRNSVVGVLQLAVFGPKGSADGPLDVQAEAARAIVNRKRLASPNQDVAFGAASGPLRRFEESWRSIVISAPFQVFETVA